MRQTTRNLLPGRRFLSALLLAHLFALLALTASPRLHRALHGDADAADHECAVVLFSHGGADEATGPLPVPGFVVSAVGFAPLPTTLTEDFVPTVFATGAVFEHGPPAAGARLS